MIVDSHVHVISEDFQRYPLKPSGQSTWYKECRVTTEQLYDLMTEAGVDRAILVQGTGAYSDDNSYSVDSAAKYPGRFASVGCVDAHCPDAADRLASWVRDRQMHGLRVFVSNSPDEAGLNESDYPLWDRAQALGTPIIVFMRPHSIPKLRRILERFPKLNVALDHLALVPLDRGPSDEMVKSFLDLARFPNLYLKFSPMILDPIAEGGLDFREAVRILAGQFGARRMIWGSNFTATHNRNYRGLVQHGKVSVSLLSQEEQGWVLGGTAAGLWPVLRSAES